MIPLFRQKPSWPAVALALLLLWAPLPFASVTPAALLALRIGSFVVLALAVWSAGADLGRGVVAVPAAALLAIAAIGLLQSVPLPASVVERLSPERLELAAEALAAGGAPERLPLSLAPSQSLSTALTFAAFAAALVAAALLGADRRNRRWLLGSILAAALFQLLYGFRHLAAGSSAVWGLEVARAGSRLRGTFVNPAHLASYLEMALALGFALAWWAIRRARRSDLGPEWRLAMVIGPILLWLLVFSGLALTRSRAALLAAAVATVTQGVVLAAYHRRWRLLPVGLVALAAGAGLVAWTGLERGLGRLLGTSLYSVTTSARLEVWRGSAELWRRFPLTGTGLGSFESAFPMVESEELAVVTWQHAHNDWLELLSTGGVLAAAAALIGLGFLIRRLHGSLLSSRSQEAAAAALAGLGALAAVAFHELFDFGLTQPANAFTLAVLLGVAAAGDADPAPL